MPALRDRRCLPCDGLTERLERGRTETLLEALHPAWQVDDAVTEIRRAFKFGDYYKTVSFVNAVAHIANAEDHHPEIEFGWGHCTVRFTTHAIGGLSENDFICAAQIDDLPYLD